MRLLCLFFRLLCITASSLFCSTSLFSFASEMVENDKRKQNILKRQQNNYKFESIHVSSTVQRGQYSFSMECSKRLWIMAKIKLKSNCKYHKSCLKLFSPLLLFDVKCCCFINIRIFCRQNLFGQIPSFCCWRCIIKIFNGSLTVSRNKITMLCMPRFYYCLIIFY